MAALTEAAFGDTPAEARSMAEKTHSDPARQCWGLREGEAVQAEDCFLTLTWDGEWDQWEIHITW